MRTVVFPRSARRDSAMSDSVATSRPTGKPVGSQYSTLDSDLVTVLVADETLEQ